MNINYLYLKVLICYTANTLANLTYVPKPGIQYRSLKFRLVTIAIATYVFFKY